MLAYTLLFIGAVLLYAVIVGHGRAVWRAIFPNAVTGQGSTPSTGGTPPPIQPQ